MTTSRWISRGVVAGLVAATVIALWFLVIGLLRGTPLETPGLLVDTMLGAGEGGTGRLLLYALLHYAVFVLIGIAVAWLLAASGTPPMLLLGVVLGVLLFDVYFYAGLMLRGVDVIDAVGWAPLLTANLLGGIAIMGYLQYSSPVPVEGWRTVMRNNRTLREGVVAGLLGAGAVAIWFLLYDLVTREAFFTPAALGSALFHGARGVDEVVLSAGTVLGYSLLHMLAFLFFGLLGAVLAAQAERHAAVLLAAVLLFVSFETLFLGLAAVAANWLLGALSAWNVLAANLIAAVVMGGYLWRAHPGLAEQFTRSDIEDETTVTQPAQPSGYP